MKCCSLSVQQIIAQINWNLFDWQRHYCLVTSVLNDLHGAQTCFNKNFNIWLLYQNKMKNWLYLLALLRVLWDILKSIQKSLHFKPSSDQRFTMRQNRFTTMRRKVAHIANWHFWDQLKPVGVTCNSARQVEQCLVIESAPLIYPGTSL